MRIAHHAGGVDTRDLSSQTMESKQPGLYFIGEATCGISALLKRCSQKNPARNKYQVFNTASKSVSSSSISDFCLANTSP